MCQFVKLHTVSPFCFKMGYIINSYTNTPIMTLDEYNELLLQDELKIGYGIPEDEFTDEFDEDAYIDGLLTDGMSEYDDRQTGTFDVDASEMFGEEVVGYSLY